MKKSRFEVRLGESCSRCGNRLWTTLKGLFRCESRKCGQKLWIVRISDKTGVRFKYDQGLTAPKEYKGWIETTR